MADFEGKIDGNGNLHIFRKGVLKRQKCPWFTLNSFNNLYCGDECPLFEEGTDNDIYLNCGGRLVKYKVEDMRPEGKS